MANNINNNNSTYYNNIYGKNNGVIELKFKDFKIKNKKLYINNKYFNENKGLIVFYAPWCNHCIKMSDSLISISIDNLNIFPIGAVNIEDTKNKNFKLTKLAKVTQIPTIKYIDKDGSLKDYNFDYNIDNLRYFINLNL